MKRTKFIAGALVLSMGLLGTGYAYWTDALEINATVRTGKLEVGFEKNGEAKLKTYANDGGEKGGSNEWCNFDGLHCRRWCDYT